MTKVYQKKITLKCECILSQFPWCPAVVFVAVEKNNFSYVEKNNSFALVFTLPFPRVLNIFFLFILIGLESLIKELNKQFEYRGVSAKTGP